jgi:hypothetical protein
VYTIGVLKQVIEKILLATYGNTIPCHVVGTVGSILKTIKSLKIGWQRTALQLYLGGATG